MSDSTAKREPSRMRPMAIPAVGRFNGTPASISASEAPQTEAIDDEPFDSVISETTRTFLFQAEDGIRAKLVTGVQTCALPILTPLLGRKSSAPEIGVPRLAFEVWR